MSGLLNQEDKLQQFLENKLSEIEFKFKSVEEWQALENKIIQSFKSPGDAKLAINEILLNALTATADLSATEKTTALQDGTFLEKVKTSLSDSGKFVTLKLARNNNGEPIAMEKIIVTIADMGGQSNFDVKQISLKIQEDYLNSLKSLKESLQNQMLSEQHTAKHDKHVSEVVTQMHGRGLLLVSQIVNNLSSSPITINLGEDIYGTKVSFSMEAAPALSDKPPVPFSLGIGQK